MSFFSLSISLTRLHTRHHHLGRPSKLSRRERPFVEVSQAHVGVDGDDREAKMGKREADVSDGGRLAEAALSGGDDDQARYLAGELGLPVPLEDGLD
ncbi:hypothetical protein Dsin_012566 [Dipteronia sinensis]|uniref:Uncharacterized protein n=1 Tax=Dipteronia sinensis TaxID=43782 RepID=A0AAE0AIH6_9ROSI|nr:hypothetical protein Dsin_012566 [Dipteronia sinensis]